MASKFIRVICVGASVNVRGGISRLLRRLKDAFPSNIQFRLVATYSEHIGDGEAKLWERCVQPLVFAWSVMQVQALALSRRPTVFHVHFSQRGSTFRKGIICVILRLLGCRFVVQGHGSDALFPKRVPSLVRRALTWGIGGARYLIVLTRYWGEYYSRELNFPSARVLVLPNPVDIPQSIPDRTSREGVQLLFLGRVGERKGAFDVIEAFAALPGAVRDRCHLTIAGDGELERARQLLEQLGCAEKASILGWVVESEVDRLLAEADVLLLPSRLEGMSMALLEGLAMGLAVVTSAAGGADEFLEFGANCLLVQPGDVDGIANAIERLAGSPELRARLSSEARTTANRYSMERYIATLTRLYEDLATAPSSPCATLTAVETRNIPTSANSSSN